MYRLQKHVLYLLNLTERTRITYKYAEAKKPNEKRPQIQNILSQIQISKNSEESLLQLVRITLRSSGPWFSLFQTYVVFLVDKSFKPQSHFNHTFIHRDN
jgi:hypothetical protein